MSRAGTFNLLAVIISSLLIFCSIPPSKCAKTGVAQFKIGDTVNERLHALRKKKVNLIFPLEDYEYTTLHAHKNDYSGGEKTKQLKKYPKQKKRKSHHKRKKRQNQHQQHHDERKNRNGDRLVVQFKNKRIDFHESLLADIPIVDSSDLEPLPVPTTTTTTRKTAVLTTRKRTTTVFTSTTTSPTTTTTLAPPPPSSVGVKLVNCSKRAPSDCDTQQKKSQSISNIPQVHTTKGIFRGLTWRTANSTIFSFLGIPYAAAPVKKLRFKIPFPLKPVSSNTIFDVSKFKPRCFPTKLDLNSFNALFSDGGTNQTGNENAFSSFDASENCLYLNIWIPRPQTLKTLAPVLVWLHGETFLSGSNKADYNTIAEFVALTKIIVVTIQYRLGVFGFSYMGAYANMGLLDQTQALQWIDESIESFGGNPNAITLMGHDLGAAFVGFHLISKISPSFFKRAIMIGGAPTQPHVFRERDAVYNATLEFASELGCSGNVLVECLMNSDPLTIWKVQTLFYSNALNALSFPFVMTNDGWVLEDNPVKLLEGKGKTGKVLIGLAANPGSTILMKTVEGILSNRSSFISYDKFLRVMTHLFGTYSPKERDFIIHQYKNWNNLEDGYANQLKVLDAMSDHYFICPLRKFSDLWSSRGLSTDFFLFSQRSSKRPDWMEAVHGDEIDFLFGMPIQNPGNYSKAEVKLSQTMLKILQDFVQSGIIPNGWERYGRETPSYVDFNGEKLPLNNKYGPRGRECDFWNELFPKL